MKHIGIILSQPPVYSETFLISKIRNLIEAGYKVTVFSQAQTKEQYFFKHKKTYPTHGIYFLLNFIPVYIKLCLFARKSTLRYYNESRKQGYSLLNAIKSCYLQAHILLEQPDWLHYEFATLAIGREHLAKALGAKMSVSIRGFDIAIYPLKHPNCYHNLWKYIDKLHTISDDLLTIALKEGLQPNTQVEKITPAIDTTKFTIKADAGSFHSPVQLITVARLHWKKGLNYQLQAALKLKAQLIKFTWHIVGDGVDKEQLLFLIKLYNLEQEVILHGKKTHAEVLDLYKSCDIYVQYSVQEGFCNAVLEAQACGLITIVSDAEGLSENVLHQVTGYVLPKRNPTLLAQQIIEVLQSQPEDLKNMATRASDRVRQEFDLEKQSKKFIAFYQS